MKSLIQYINEEYKTYRVSDLTVEYKCQPEQTYIKFRVPEVYTEDNLQIYMQDKYFSKLPGDAKLAEKYFGANAGNIYDVLFTYDRYEKGVEGGDCVEWDSSIDDRHKSDEDNFTYVQISGLKYIIKFDEFDLNTDKVSNINETLVNIFKAVESTEFPLELKLLDKNITYTDDEN